MHGGMQNPANAHMYVYAYACAYAYVMCTRRWGVPLEGYSGEEYLQALADRRFTVCCRPVLRPQGPKARGWSQSGWR